MTLAVVVVELLQPASHAKVVACNLADCLLCCRIFFCMHIRHTVECVCGHVF